MKTQTSVPGLLCIDALPFGPAGGLIGLASALGHRWPGDMSGSHPRNLEADLDSIAAWNAAAVVTLVETHEFDALAFGDIGAQVRRRHMEWHHWPIGDHQVPDAGFMAEWPARSALLRGLLARGGRVLVHCNGGLGRSASVASRLLVDDGVAADAAINAVGQAGQGVRLAPAQATWVTAGRPAPLPKPDRSRDAARDRAVGALLGLAVGDALGAAMEFEPKPQSARLTDMVAGGPHKLKRGEWTDDTAMALALADSLAADAGLDAADLMRRFLAWADTGAYSCTGACFDIGIQTRNALERFRLGHNPLAGCAQPSASGNGALMRLAPVAIRHWRDRAVMAQVAEVQTRTTHGSPATLTASGTFATMLADAIAGDDINIILSSTAATKIEGGWRGLHRNAIEGTGYVVRSLQAAIWAVSRSTDFRSAVLLAANLGQDADTTAAIAGQLAGATFGASGIPPEWLGALAWRGRLETTAERLFDAGASGLNPYSSQDWSLRERLEALAGFRPVFEREGFSFAENIPPLREGDITVFGGTVLGEDASRFYQVVYDYGWVEVFDWCAWRKTPKAYRLMNDPPALADASAEELAQILTTCVRADRFCDGYLASAFEAGLITRVIVHADQLLSRLVE